MVHLVKYFLVENVVNKVNEVPKVKLDDLVCLAHLVKMLQYHWSHLVRQVSKDTQATQGKIPYFRTIIFYIIYCLVILDNLVSG